MKEVHNAAVALRGAMIELDMAIDGGKRQPIHGGKGVWNKQHADRFWYTHSM